MEASVERAARLHQEAVVSEKEGLIATLKELIEKLEGQVEQYRRAKFGPKSEKLHPDQLQLALEDIETAIAETQEQIAAVERQIEATQAEPDRTPRKPRKERKLPDTLPRVEQVIEPESIACPCGCGDMVRIGEDRAERLDVIPARYQVIVTIRPRYACPKGRTGVLQAAAPAHLLEGSWPTEALLAHIAVAKHSEHMPLNRQAVVMARHPHHHATAEFDCDAPFSGPPVFLLRGHHHRHEGSSPILDDTLHHLRWQGQQSLPCLPAPVRKLV